jgi:hypothetical protein
MATNVDAPSAASRVSGDHSPDFGDEQLHAPQPGSRTAGVTLPHTPPVVHKPAGDDAAVAALTATCEPPSPLDRRQPAAARPDSEPDCTVHVESRDGGDVAAADSAEAESAWLREGEFYTLSEMAGRVRIQDRHGDVNRCLGFVGPAFLVGE